MGGGGVGPFKSNPILGSTQQRRSGSLGWLKDASLIFSVRSAYYFLHRSAPSPPLDAFSMQIFARFWRSKVSSMVLAFSWRLMLDRLPTREQLLHRNIIFEKFGSSCVFCFAHLETANHLFFSCSRVYGVWLAVYQQLGVSCVLHNEVVPHYVQHGALFRGKRLKKIKFLIWHVVTWSIWLLRNTIIFRGGVFDFCGPMDLIKVRSWNVLEMAVEKNICSFSDWCISPISCLVAATQIHLSIFCLCINRWFGFIITCFASVLLSRDVSN